MNALRQRIDAAFLPRPLCLVDALPRNATGKLPRQALDPARGRTRGRPTEQDPTVIERVFQPDHPASRGHFPGNPIIPGAVLLSETLLAIEAALGARLAPFQITSAKFLHPARPGDRVVIEFSRTPRAEVRFACTVRRTERC